MEVYGVTRMRQGLTERQPFQQPQRSWNLYCLRRLAFYLTRINLACELNLLRMLSLNDNCMPLQRC